MDLFLETTTAVQEITKFLKCTEKIKERRHFYSHLLTHCVLLRNHASNNRSTTGSTNQIFLRMLDRLESLIKRDRVTSLSRNAHYPGLQSLVDRWHWIRSQNSETKAEFISQSIDFGFDTELHNEILEYFEECEEKLESQCLENPDEDSTDEFVPSRKSATEPSYAVRSAAQSLFKALVAAKCCHCPPTHELGAFLSLSTFRDSATDEDFSFDMFLALQNHRQETHIQTVRDSIVQFALDGHAKSSQVRKMEVKKLCESIEKIRSMTSKRLKLKLESGMLPDKRTSHPYMDRLTFTFRLVDQLWKLQSERSCFQVDTTRKPMTLEYVLSEKPDSLNEKTKRILAVLLSFTVLHFYGTPWLQTTWGSSNILFFQTTSSTIPLRPYLDVRLVHELTFEKPTAKNDIDPDGSGLDDIDDIDPDEPLTNECPLLTTLAVLLMEVFHSMPFITLAKRYTVDIDNTSDSQMRWIHANEVFDMCKLDMNSQFRHAVEKCLDPQTWEDAEGERLSTETLRMRIYEEIVRPLEDELGQAFSYIPIEELDKVAQTLDFGCWGQTISTGEPILSPQPTAQSISFAEHVSFTHEQYPSLSLEHHVRPFSAESINLAVEQAVQTPARGLSPSSQYHRAKFFDDETIPDGQSTAKNRHYQQWKEKYLDVYHRYITERLAASQFVPAKIAVLDTGIDISHPDIEACENRIKDRCNWFEERFKGKRSIPDHHGHGTHVAGILLEYAPHAELYIAKVASKNPSDPRLIAKAIDHAVDTWGVDIISMSFGFPTRNIDGYRDLEYAIMKAHSKHVLLFAAASNSGANLDRAYPARNDHVICIHSTDHNGNRSPFSPTPMSSKLNFATLGESVASSWPTQLCDNDESNFIQSKSGTSFATPIAAGIAAFLIMFARCHLGDECVERMKDRSGMEAVLDLIARKSKSRDGYQYLHLSLFSDNVFGKHPDLVKEWVRDALMSS